MATKKTTRKKTARKPAAKKAATKKTTKKTATKSAAGTKKASRKKASASKAGGPVRVEREIGGRTLSLETGRMAKLADGAVVARYGDTMVLATAQAGSQRDDIDFFPLTVDYRERAAAAGKFPGGFFKREGRPTTRETLTCRIIDRSIRPLFVDGFRAETQVLSQVLCSDKENDSDIAAAVASFAALAVSSIPNGKTLGACRVGLIDDQLVINPRWTELQSEENSLNLTVSAHKDAIVMVEAAADEVPEEVILEALELAHDVCSEIAEMVEELVDLAGKDKQEVVPPARDTKLDKQVLSKFGKDLAAAPVAEGNKFERGKAMKAAKNAVLDAFPAPDPEDEAGAAAHKKYLENLVRSEFKKGERASILKGRRADGRKSKDIRDISVEVDILPTVHGSALFTRGETQALCIATLGTELDTQTMDGIYPEDPKRWLLHYSFPPYSVGEVRRFLAPGRREIGHGALAERAIEAILPKQAEFPYTLRVTSDIMMSNGSSSMASVCGGTLALMDAGVPIRQPVAGIAMGLVVEDDDIAILSDILGSEDGCGDMDFKVAGTGKGITALQMDIKCEGLARETLQEAMEQARDGRLHILREMLKVLRQPRSDVSPNAPRLISLKVNPEKVGSIIGPGGRTIRALQEEFETRISVGDAGVVEIAGFDGTKVDACIARIEDMTADVEMGKVYKGRVTGIKEFGAFVELLPGQEGLVHVSELSGEFIKAVTDVVNVGDEIEVKVIDIDDFGKVKLSRKALLPASESGGDGEEERPRRGRRPRRDEDEGAAEDRGGRRRRPRRDDADFDDDEPRRERGRRDRGDGDDEPRGRGRGRDRDRDEEPRGRGRRDRDDEPRGRSRRDRDDEPRGRSRRDRDEEPRGRGRRDRDDEPRGRSRRDRDDEPRGRSRRDRDDEPRGRDRDDEPRGRDRDEEPRGRSRRSEGGEREFGAQEEGYDEDRPRPRRRRRR